MRKIEPEYLGPLTDRPLAETTTPASPSELFAGMSAFLAARHQRRRQEQWNAVTPLVDRLLRPEEHILYVSHAMQVPPPLHYLSLGYMALTYHQVMLVLTDTRLIEVLIGVRGKKAETRIRSFPWASVRSMKMSMGQMRLIPVQGKKQSWRVPLRGDRKLMELIMARLKPRFLQEGAGMAEPLPIFHCPQCGAKVSANPASCDACRTPFRSTRLAALLSLAFPGAGLFYAGHPFLAAADFLGEVLLYGLFVLLMLEAEPGTVGVIVGIGALFLVITKLESVHLSQILVARTKPDTESRRSMFQRVSLIGGIASLVLIGCVFPLAGAGRAVVDRDLAIDGAGGSGGQAEPDSQWQVSRDMSEWSAFADDPTARSQWRAGDGALVTLFAYPQHLLDNASEFRREVRKALVDQGLTLVVDDENVPSPFHGFRFVTRGENEEGEPVSAAQYFVLDEENRDIHQAVAAVLDEDAAMVEGVVREFLSHATWVAATEPLRPAAAEISSR